MARISFRFLILNTHFDFDILSAFNFFELHLMLLCKDILGSGITQLNSFDFVSYVVIQCFYAARYAVILTNTFDSAIFSL